MEKVTADQFYRSIRFIEQNLRKKYPHSDSLVSLIQDHVSSQNETSKTLDLGCGSKPRNPFNAQEIHGIDLRNDLAPTVKQANLAIEKIPYPNNSFNYCTAFDFIEHIPRILWVRENTRNCFIELMNEIHRILLPGGLFLHLTPSYPSLEAFQDPTHVNIITEDTFPIYFCEPQILAKHIGYGFDGRFELVKQAWIGNKNIAGVMRALK